MEHHISTFSALTYTISPWGLSQKVETFFFLKSVILHNRQIRREWSIDHQASTYPVLTHTLGPCGGSKGQNNFFLKVVKLHIKLKGFEPNAPLHRLRVCLRRPSTRGLGLKVQNKSECSYAAYQIIGTEVKIRKPFA